MCMRMSSDAGRDFLSTKDPVRKEPRHNESVDADKNSGAERRINFGDMLEQYFKGRNRK